MTDLVKRLSQEHSLEASEFVRLIDSCDNITFDYIRQQAVATAQRWFGKGIYIRGLLEISSYCKNDCLYCGLRRSNVNADRYRLSSNEILNCCSKGYKAGIRTFVLQGGEDFFWNDEQLVSLVSKIHESYPDVAITLSLGERSQESYSRLYEAGATRYLLRHETACNDLYRELHPAEMSHAQRLNCVKTLIDTGYQTGVGMMIGVPGQTTETLVKDLLLMRNLNPQMIGIGPFIPHKDTPLADERPGSVRLTLLMLSILRLMFPDALIPATTALVSLTSDGHSLGVLSGANVIMPNLTPINVRDKYAIYNNKVNSGNEAVEGLSLLERELNSIGYHIDYSRGDYKNESIC